MHYLQLCTKEFLTKINYKNFIKKIYEFKTLTLFSTSNMHIECINNKCFSSLYNNEHFKKGKALMSIFDNMKNKK